MSFRLRPDGIITWPAHWGGEFLLKAPVAMTLEEQRTFLCIARGLVANPPRLTADEAADVLGMRPSDALTMHDAVGLLGISPENKDA